MRQGNAGDCGPFAFAFVAVHCAPALTSDETGVPRMIVTTTATLQDRRVNQYLGLVTGESILGANIFRDMFAGIRDIVGGRAGAYEKVLRDARRMAVDEMVAEARKLGANAVIGVDVDYETVGGGTMLMVSVSGTAVQVD